MASSVVDKLKQCPGTIQDSEGGEHVNVEVFASIMPRLGVNHTSIILSN